MGTGVGQRRRGAGVQQSLGLLSPSLPHVPSPSPALLPAHPSLARTLPGWSFHPTAGPAIGRSLFRSFTPVALTDLGRGLWARDLLCSVYCGQPKAGANSPPWAPRLLCAPLPSSDHVTLIKRLQWLHKAPRFSQHTSFPPSLSLLQIPQMHPLQGPWSLKGQLLLVICSAQRRPP